MGIKKGIILNIDDRLHPKMFIYFKVIKWHLRKHPKKDFKIYFKFKTKFYSKIQYYIILNQP